MPTKSTYVTYSELFDRMPTEEELNDIVKDLNAFNTVVLTSRLNTMLWHSMWSQNPQDAKSLSNFQRWFAGIIFDDDTQQRIRQKLGAQDPKLRPVCIPLQLLNIIRLALSVAEARDSIARWPPVQSPAASSSSPLPDACRHSASLPST